MKFLSQHCVAEGNEVNKKTEKLRLNYEKNYAKNVFFL